MKTIWNCLLLGMFCALATLAAGCAKEKPSKVTAPAVEPPLGVKPSTILKDPKRAELDTPTGPARERSKEDLFKAMDSDESGELEEEELRMANLYCATWYPPERHFVESIYEKRAQYGHVVEKRVLQPASTAPDQRPITVHRYGVTRAEFNAAWDKLRGPEGHAADKSDSR